MDGIQAKAKTEENSFVPYGGQWERNIKPYESSTLIMSTRLHVPVPFTNASLTFVNIVWSSKDGFSIAGTNLVLRVFRQPHSKMVIYDPALPASQSLWILVRSLWLTICVPENGSREEIHWHGKGRVCSPGSERWRWELGSVWGAVQAWEREGCEPPWTNVLSGVWSCSRWEFTFSCHPRIHLFMLVLNDCHASCIIEAKATEDGCIIMSFMKKSSDWVLWNILKKRQENMLPISFP